MNKRNGKNGSPVIGQVTVIKPRNNAAKNSEYGFDIIWLVKSPPRELLPADARVITIPAAIDIKREGSCEARPSPIVNTVYLVTASPIGIWFTKQPIIKPPTMLIITMMIPAIVSPFTNFMEPSIEPKRLDSLCKSSRLFTASSGDIKPALKSASIVICLPGIASNAKRAATSAIRSAPFVITIN